MLATVVQGSRSPAPLPLHGIHPKSGADRLLEGRNPSDTHRLRLRAPLRDGHRSYFGQLNAGKRSLALDLKHPEALALVKQLVAEADVVVENFRPGVMERLGLGSATLRALNPRLVYCAISGYGQTGPGAERAAYAMIVHAASGFDRTLMRCAGDREHPDKGAVFIADVLAAVFAFSAIQTALLQRHDTGQGQHIDVALMDCMLNLLVYEMQEAQFPVRTPRPTCGPVRAGDGELMVAPITPRNFTAVRGDGRAWRRCARIRASPPCPRAARTGAR